MYIFTGELVVYSDVDLVFWLIAITYKSPNSSVHFAENQFTH